MPIANRLPSPLRARLGEVIESRPPLTPKRMSNDAKDAYVIVVAVGGTTADQDRVVRPEKADRVHKAT